MNQQHLKEKNLASKYIIATYYTKLFVFKIPINLRKLQPQKQNLTEKLSEYQIRFGHLKTKKGMKKLIRS